MKLKEVVVIAGKIRCVTGLSIGGSSTALEIGGIAKEVVKNPLTKDPYIPGSSLKGKMRSELEKKYGAFQWIDENKAKSDEVYEKRGRLVRILDKKNPCGCGNKECLICKIFGAHKNPNADSGPTRIIVRDAPLSEEWTNDSSLIIERKVENIVNRESNTADSPRTIERVSAGVSFDFEIILRIFEGDNKKELLSKVKEGLELVENSYLGGGGSRGSGQIKFEFSNDQLNSIEKEE